MGKIRRMVVTHAPTEDLPNGIVYWRILPTNCGSRSNNPSLKRRGDPCWPTRTRSLISTLTHGGPSLALNIRRKTAKLQPSVAGQSYHFTRDSCRLRQQGPHSYDILYKSRIIKIPPGKHQPCAQEPCRTYIAHPETYGGDRADHLDHGCIYSERFRSRSGDLIRAMCAKARPGNYGQVTKSPDKLLTTEHDKRPNKTRRPGLERIVVLSAVY